MDKHIGTMRVFAGLVLCLSIVFLGVQISDLWISQVANLSPENAEVVAPHVPPPAAAPATPGPVIPPEDGASASAPIAPVVPAAEAEPPAASVTEATEPQSPPVELEQSGLPAWVKGSSTRPPEQIASPPEPAESQIAAWVRRTQADPKEKIAPAAEVVEPVAPASMVNRPLAPVAEVNQPIAPALGEDPAPTGSRYVSTERLNVRAAPSARSAVIVELSRNAKVELISIVGTWMQVRIPDGRVGYVSARYTADQPV